MAAAELAAAGLLALEIPAPSDRQLARQRLIALISDSTLSASHAVRAQAGRTLSQLGDTRPGVGVFVRAAGLKLPDIAWGKEIAPGIYPYQNGTVEIKQAYQLARYPITYAQFQCFIDAPDVNDAAWWQGMPPDSNNKWYKQYFPYANHPRESVSWYQAVAFCRWLSHQLGLEIRLPHEEEWEVAARYPDDRSYPWGNEWNSNNTNTSESGIGQTTAVGLYPHGPHPDLRLYDLSGNVSEWCQNKYLDPTNEMVYASNDWRAVRGGSWDSDQSQARGACRSSYHPKLRDFDLGYRVVRCSLSH